MVVAVAVKILGQRTVVRAVVRLRRAKRLARELLAKVTTVAWAVLVETGRAPVTTPAGVVAVVVAPAQLAKQAMLAATTKPVTAASV